MESSDYVTIKSHKILKNLKTKFKKKTSPKFKNKIWNNFGAPSHGG